jgi:hypothetical protein
MISPSDAADFVLASYSVAGIGWGGLTLWAWLRWQRVRQEWRRFDSPESD